jgi:hypothetical protein
MASEDRVATYVGFEDLYVAIIEGYKVSTQG